MTLLSCANCWFNGLQYDALGAPVGYCVRHRRLLQCSGETTCGQLMRKDLPLAAARQENEIHRQSFEDAPIVWVRSGERYDEGVADESADLATVRADRVGELVLDYGELGAKIESLAQLRGMPGARAELALLSLARGYVSNCVDRGGAWTAGAHLLWWTRRRLDEVPSIDLMDIRAENGLPLRRKVELAQWSLMTLRLSFVADVGSHAQAEKHALAPLASLLDEAARSVDRIHPRSLSSWIRRVVRPWLDRLFPEAEYRQLAASLSQAQD